MKQIKASELILFMQIKENVSFVKKQIAEACEKTKRDEKKITIIGVTKTRSIKEIQELVNAGVKNVGENKAQELESKFIELKKLDVQIHFIGHVQSNKAKKIVEMADYIHSVDSLKLLKKINSSAKEIGKVQNIFLEINSGEEEKYGLEYKDADALLEEAKKMKNINVLGLMTMAPFTENKEVIRECFLKLKEKSYSIGLKELSIGMSNDYKIAVEEGATFLRIGTRLFE